jgi:hypothetical protein
MFLADYRCGYTRAGKRAVPFYGSSTSRRQPRYGCSRPISITNITQLVIENSTRAKRDTVAILPQSKNRPCACPPGVLFLRNARFSGQPPRKRGGEFAAHGKPVVPLVALDRSPSCWPHHTIGVQNKTQFNERTLRCQHQFAARGRRGGLFGGPSRRLRRL